MVAGGDPSGRPAVLTGGTQGPWWGRSDSSDRGDVTRRLLLGLLAALLLAAGPLPTTAGGAPLAAVHARAETASRGPGVVLRVGSYNIRADRTLGQFRRAVRAFRRHVDVAGLQEVDPPAKNTALQRMRGWGSYHPRQWGPNPIIWRTRALRLVGGHGTKLAEGRFVGDEKPRSETSRPDQWATVARFHRRGGGGRISVVNAHPVAGAVTHGHCFDSRPLLCGLYQDTIRGLARTVRAERRWAHDRVWLVGDLNDDYPWDKQRHRAGLAYAVLSHLGLRAHWEAGPLDKGGGSGTRKGAYLDQIWSARAAVRIDTLRSITLSDHYPVTADYRLRG